MTIDMKTIQLQKIKSKCECLIQSSLENSHGPRTEASIAAWKSTIAAIDGFQKLQCYNAPMEVLNPSMTMVASYTEANESIKSIISAWPEELL